MPAWVGSHPDVTSVPSGFTPPCKPSPTSSATTATTMRPPRIAILVFFLTASLFLLCRALTSAARSSNSAYPAAPKSQKSVWGFVYYNTPFSLFPPNAAISLTDDNSTSFAARPAAFGPKLAPRGLSGQLWVGSGFSEDTLDSDGELGCSDLPGWDGASLKVPSVKDSFTAASPRIPISVAKASDPKHGEKLIDPDEYDASAKHKSKAKSPKPPPDDGTDSYLNEAITGSRNDPTVSAPHADIQSIQETGEIEGKIVLLKRGGCGFLEKVMWAQRRGAVAVVVGDNKKGGPLIQMFAHGEEVENVTIPSVFTARTTAHLLSSLTQPGSFIEDTLDDSGNPVLKVQQAFKSNKKQSKDKKNKEKDTKEPKGAAASSKVVGASSKDKATSSKDKTGSSKNKRVADNPLLESRGWISRVFRWHKPSHPVDDNGRPVSSGQLDWVLEENDKTKSSGKDSIEVNDSKGGSTTPGSNEPGDVASSGKGSGVADPRLGLISSGGNSKGHGFISKLFGDHDEEHEPESGSLGADEENDDDPYTPSNPNPDARNGLWVTITPTSSASPFFDTLLVLVISPLVTLTVVYALLILRARIRRRRWRAPKSVVERLPVRTYHTVATSRSSSPRLPSPSSSTPTPTTPLLQQQRSPSRTRPRSRTTTGVLESENFLSPTSAVPTPRASSRTRGRNEHEKGAGGFSAEWRKYMGRQVECVVCLEEYVDGVSKVMSLPCGHEFHADCM